MITSKYRAILRFVLNKKNRKRLQNKDFTVISQNCVGGVLLHELKLRFNSPTINLYFSAADFIKFISKLDYYLTMDVVQINSDRPYPVGKLDDIVIYFVHYTSFEEARNKWIERASRINKNNIFFIMTQTDDCTSELVHEFGRLPLKNKVIFTAKEYPDVPCSIYIPGSEKDHQTVIDLCQYKSKYTGKRWVDEFDYVDFFNRGFIRDEKQ